MNLYSKASIYFENLAQSEYSNLDEDENVSENEKNELLSYYDNTSQTNIALGHDFTEIPDEWWETNKENIDLFILEKQLNDQVKNPTRIFENIQEMKDKFQKELEYD